MVSDPAKLFVGGISSVTSEDTLNEYFTKYGEVLLSVVAKDRDTKKPRGFGFVWFSNSSSADSALQDTHVILGRTVEVKRAIPRSEPQQRQKHHQQNHQHNSGLSQNCSTGGSNNQFSSKKIFVGGLSASLTENEFKSYFERFGRITDLIVMHDSATQRPRGFGFVTFESEESVDNVLQKSFHELNSKLVEVKRAVPKDALSGCDSHYGTIGIKRQPGYKNSQFGYNTPCGPGYGDLPVYGPPPEYNGVGGYSHSSGYPMIGYGRIGYGFNPFMTRNPWDGFMMSGGWVCPLSYGNCNVYSVYPSFVHGEASMVAGGFSGMVRPLAIGKLNHTYSVNENPVAIVRPIQKDREKLDANSSDLKESIVIATGEQN